MAKANKETGIKTWPKDDRPREKLLKNGEEALSDAEFLAIILRVGVRGQSALDLASGNSEGTTLNSRNERSIGIRVNPGIRGHHLIP